MSQHTPGPWTLQELPHQHGFRKGVTYAVRDARNCCLAQVGHVDAIHDGAESKANARLIALAPAMREMLALVTDAYEEAYSVAYPLHDTSPSVIIPRARTLLATIERA